MFPALLKVISVAHGHECTTQNLSRLAYEHNHWSQKHRHLKCAHRGPEGANRTCLRS